jgi:hypothetical protein
LFGSIHYATLIAQKGGVTMAVTDHDRKVGALLGLDPARIAENRRRAEEEADAKGIPPLSRERIKEYSAFSAEISDEEFEEYMAFINAERGRT